MVPQARAPGAEAEVDFGEFQAVIAGMAAKLWMFVMRLSCSDRAFNVAFATRATTKCARRSVPAVDGVMRTSEARSGHCRLGFGGLASRTEAAGGYPEAFLAGRAGRRRVTRVRNGQQSE
jgi:hypothetical protein